MKQILFLSQIILLLIQLTTYLFSSIGPVSFFVVNLSAITVVISFFLSWNFRKKTKVKNHSFSVILFFTLMSWIISFQVPLEIVYGNNKLLDSSLALVYDMEVLNNMVSFSSLMLNFFLLGVTYSYNKVGLVKNVMKSKDLNIATYPLVFLIIISLAIFLFTVDSNYIDGGHGGGTALDSISASTAGIAIKLSVIYLSIKIYLNSNKRLNLVKFIFSLNVYYVALLVTTIFIFLLAHNRLFPIMLATPLLFSYFLATKKKIGLMKVVSIFLSLSIFATLFKIYDINNFYKAGLYIDSNYTISNSFFPFTAELAGSFYSSNILYSMWYKSDFTLNGISYIVGLLRTVPGLAGLINLNPLIYDSAVIATVYSNTSYGVGSTSIFDLLVNFGVPLSLILFSILGYFFGRSEVNAYTKEASINSYIIYLSITILILFYPRASLNDLFPMVVFNLVFFRFYFYFFGRRLS